MNWRWWRRCGDDEERPATDAVKSAREKLAETQQRGKEVREVTEDLRAMRRRNRFAEMIADTMRLRP